MELEEMLETWANGNRLDVIRYLKAQKPLAQLVAFTLQLYFEQGSDQVHCLERLLDRD